MERQQQAWQGILNQAAYFNVMVTPDPQCPNVPISMPGSTERLAGVQVHGIGHRFDVTLHPPTLSAGLRASNVVGPVALACHFRWVPIPDDFWAAPDREPPLTPLDLGRGQRFALMNGEFCFGPGGENRFASIGTGRTFPLPGGGETLSIAAIGTILEGAYKFERCQGVYVMSGFFTPPYDFRLNILIRVNDPAGTIVTETALPAAEPAGEPAPGTTYLYVRTMAEPETTQLTLGPGGAPQRLETMEKITLDQLRFAVQGMYGLKSSRQIGPVIGQHPLTARFFPTPATTGTPASPVPFDDTEEFLFTDNAGTVLGSIQAPVIEGRAVLTPLAGIPEHMAPQIFGGFAPITGGTGQFAGVTGIVTNVGGGTVGPHLTDLVYMFQLVDPTGRYRVPAGHEDA